MVASKETGIYRQDARLKGTFLSPKEREKILEPFLPSPPQSKAVNRRPISQSLRDLLSGQLHLLVFAILHVLFSIYIRLRQAYHVILDRIFAILYYHHRAPELVKRDIKELSRLPKHLSIILELKQNEGNATALDSLMDQIAEISAWCSCVGIPMLSVYEKSGILKPHLSKTHRVVTSKMHAYHGRHIPHVEIGAPHTAAISNARPDMSGNLDESPDFSVLLLSAEDGRSTIVDLTKTLAEMSQRKKLLPSDITRELVDAEITESVMGEPDLLVLFGPSVELQGYPPWQVRLTEIFHCEDNTSVGYQVFLRALHSYANAQMRLGR